MATTNNIQFGGWPYGQHAMDTRGTQTVGGSNRASIVYPRRKYTFVVEFVINSRVFISNPNSDTHLMKYVRNGRLLSTLRSIDHPQPVIGVTKLRSYNKYVNIITN